MSIIPLDTHDEFELTGDSDMPVKASRQHHAQSGIMLLRDSSSAGDAHCVLLIHPDANLTVRINGDPLYAGIRILRDRDEILISYAVNQSQRLYFSTERKARIESFASDHEVSCMRCHQGISPGSLIVRCPSCSALHHESAELLCYSYAPTCANGMCSHPTVMDEEFSWTPDYLMGR
jgi:hypothetical protein